MHSTCRTLHFTFPCCLKKILNVPHYGTRDAQVIWQDHLRETLLDMKFKESVAHPWMFQHETRDILLCVHVDEMLFTGLRDDRMWLKKHFLKSMSWRHC